jgi:hypothetical protein
MGRLSRLFVSEPTLFDTLRPSDIFSLSALDVIPPATLALASYVMLPSVAAVEGKKLRVFNSR